jgi:hypothetical protein
MRNLEDMGFEVHVRDVSGQKAVDVGNILPNDSVGQMIDQLLVTMSLPPNDPVGRPYSYHMRLEREGRHLNRAERLGDVLQQGDEMVLVPNVDAGGGRSSWPVARDQ